MAAVVTQPVITEQTSLMTQPVAVIPQPSGISRLWYLIFYVIYLAMLLTALWFMISLSNVPNWVFFLFLAASIMWVLIAIGRETLLTAQMLPDGTLMISPLSTFWTVMYWILAATATGLTIAGFVLVIINSTVPWWVWLLILVAWLVSFLGQAIGMITNSPSAWIFSVFIAVLAGITYIIAIILIILYSNLPWWVWLLFGLSFLFGLIAAALEPFSKKTVLRTVALAPGVPVCPPGTVPVAMTTAVNQVAKPSQPVSFTEKVAAVVQPVVSQSVATCPLVGMPAVPVATRTEPVIVPKAPVVISPGGVVNPVNPPVAPTVTVQPPVVVQAPKVVEVAQPVQQKIEVQTLTPPSVAVQPTMLVQEEIGPTGQTKAVPVASPTPALPPLSTLICALPGSSVPRQVDS